MTDTLTVVLLIIGSGFGLVAGIALVRMPDLYTRMHGATKCATLGLGCVLAAVAIHFGQIGIITRVLLIVGFVFLTSPVAAHIIGRSAYILGVPLWHGTTLNELPKKEQPDRTKPEPKGST
jgi:multicomponent Na+:H+ antiporter subunit G